MIKRRCKCISFLLLKLSFSLNLRLCSRFGSANDLIDLVLHKNCGEKNTTVKSRQRNEIENGKTLFLADKPEYKRCGLEYARLRFTTEDADTCVAVFKRYLGMNDFVPEDYTRGLFYRGVD